MRLTTVWTVALAAMVAVWVSPVAGMTVALESAKEECFFEDMEVKDPFSFVYQVTSGGYLDVDVRVEDPAGIVLFQAAKETSGRFEHVAKKMGGYKFCFSNKMSSVTMKTVTFEIVVDRTSEKEAAGRDALTPLDNSVNKISDMLAKVRSEQNYLRMREKVHGQTTSSTGSRVFYWSIAESAVMLGMAIWQIVYLRKFFEVKRVV